MSAGLGTHSGKVPREADCTAYHAAGNFIVTACGRHHPAAPMSALPLTTVVFPQCLACRVVCMSCGANTCRHEHQRRLAALNPGLAERVAELTRSGITTRGAWQRALRAGTAADARKVVASAREAAEQVRTVSELGIVAG